MQEKAQLWLQFGSRSDIPPRITVWCCTGALHFAQEDGNLQSEIYRVRALSYYKLGNEMKCEQDAKESKILNINPTWVSFVIIKLNREQKLRPDTIISIFMHIYLYIRIFYY